jgi:trk system potassium uptake protein TrkA
MMTLLKLSRGQFSLDEVIVPQEARAAGILIRDLELPEQCVIVSIFRKGMMILPRGSTRIEAGDEVIVITSTEAAHQLADLFSPQNLRTQARA